MSDFKMKYQKKANEISGMRCSLAYTCSYNYKY